jgi:hypothetical protein
MGVLATQSNTKDTMRPCFFILDANNNPQPVDDLDQVKFPTRIRQVQVTSTVMVSTVFLSIDHGFGRYEGGEPVLFESMVFGGALSGEQQRYCTYSQALQGHEEMLTRVKRSLWQRLRKRKRATFKIQQRAICLNNTY